MRGEEPEVEALIVRSSDGEDHRHAITGSYHLEGGSGTVIVTVYSGLVRAASVNYRRRRMNMEGWGGIDGPCDAEESYGGRERLIRRRDELLREVRALENRAVGLGMAIKIVAEENPHIAPDT